MKNYLEDNNVSTLSLFGHYLIPSISSMIGISLYILADTFFIANGVGSMALAALNIILPVYSLSTALGMMVGIGGATLFSVKRGKNELNELSGIFTLCILMAIMFGGVYVISGVFFTEKLVRLLGASETILPYGTEYMRIISLLMPFFIVNNVLVSFVRNDNNPRLAMSGVIIGSLVNIVLDYVFIYTFGWGMNGAALATCISPIISISLCFKHLLSPYSHLKLNFKGIKLGYIKDIVIGGISSFLTELSGGIIMFIFNIVILDLAGELGVAAYGVIANIALVCTAIFTGTGQAIQPIVSYDLGSDNYKRIRAILKMSILVSFILGILVYTLSFAFALPISNAFNKDSIDLFNQLTVRGIKLYFIAFIIAGINIVSASFFQSVLWSKTSGLISFMKGFLLIIVGILFLPKLLGLDGVWLTVVFAEGLTFLISIFYLTKWFNNNKSHI